MDEKYVKPEMREKFAQPVYLILAWELQSRSRMITTATSYANPKMHDSNFGILRFSVVRYVMRLIESR